MTTQQLILSHCIRNSSLFKRIKGKSNWFECDDLKFYNILCKMVHDKIPINPVNVYQVLKNINVQEHNIELYMEITDQANSIYSDDEFKDLCRQCAEDDFRKYAKKLNWDDLSIDELKSKLAEKSLDLDYRVKKQISNLQRGLEQYLKVDEVFIESGFDWIDENIGGWSPSEYIIIAARPGEGKTTLALNIATRLLKKKLKVGMFSAEMPERSIAINMLAMETGIDAMKIRKKIYSNVEKEKLYQKADYLHGLPFYIDDTPNIEIEILEMQAKRMQEKFGIQALIIDYVQIVTTDLHNKEPLREQINYISRKINGIKRDLNIPVFALAQLTRDAQGEEPKINQLKECGALEQDADKIIFIYNTDNGITPDTVDSQIIFAKNRSGSCGRMKCKFQKPCLRFTEVKFKE
jgi:replicative DNA helicase